MQLTTSRYNGSDLCFIIPLDNIFVLQRGNETLTNNSSTKQQSQEYLLQALQGIAVESGLER